MGRELLGGYLLVVRVQANDRSGLLRDITTILANEKVNVLGVASRSDTKQQMATIDMTIEIYNLQVLGRVLGKLNQVPGCDRRSSPARRLTPTLISAGSRCSRLPAFYQDRLMTQIERLLAIMRRLRDPENGCPWDKEQTFATIAWYTLEEIYEVLDAIAREDFDDLRSELGDLLFQRRLHAQMAQEEGRLI